MKSKIVFLMSAYQGSYFTYLQDYLKLLHGLDVSQPKVLPTIACKKALFSTSAHNTRRTAD